MKIIEIQQALAALGLRPGPLDGIWGRQTAAALREFQAKNGLVPDGIIGPQTLAALAPKHKQPAGLEAPSIVWFKEACRLLGTREKPGAGSNDEILEWAEKLDTAYPNDDIPWCGLFVGHCIASTLDREPTPAGLLRARSWERFGIPTKPTPGAVMVFWRISKGDGRGHVGFYAGQNEEGTAYRILGGNQSDSVSLAWISADRLVASRWPSTVSAPIPSPVVVKLKDKLSWNEA